MTIYLSIYLEASCFHLPVKLLFSFLNISAQSYHINIYYNLHPGIHHIWAYSWIVRRRVKKIIFHHYFRKWTFVTDKLWIKAGYDVICSLFDNDWCFGNLFLISIQWKSKLKHVNFYHPGYQSILLSLNYTTTVQ